MKRLIWLLLIGSAFAQIYPYAPPAPTSVGHSWTFVQSSSGQNGRAVNVSCTAAACTITIASKGTGNGAIILETDGAGSGITISSVTGNCSSWVVDSGAHSSSGTNGDANGAYCLSTLGGVTSVVVNLSTTAPGTTQLFYYEGNWSGSSISHDTSGEATQTSGTTYAGVGLTLAATDMVAQATIQGNSGVVNSISSPYNTFFLNTDGGSDYSFAAAAMAFTATGTAPTWTPAASTGANVNAVALKGN